MRGDVREAIESACSVDLPPRYSAFGPRRTISAERVRALVYAVVRELPDDMSVAELRDDLEIANNQEAGA